MNGDGWTFDKRYWHDRKFNAIGFVGVKDGERHTFLIAVAALDYYFRTSDTLEAAIANFEAHRPLIETVAKRVYAEGLRSQEYGHHFITRVHCERYGC